MAQTTISSGNMKFINENEASLTYYYTNSEAMGGFQMVVSLPDGVTLEENAKKTENGLSINGGEPSKNAVFYNVTVPSGFECIGVKADVDGTTSDGTAYKLGDVLLVCFPVEAGAEYQGTTKESKLCTLRLTTVGDASEDILQNVAIKGFAGSDTKGTGGAEVAAKYAASADSNLSPAMVLKEADANGDKEINVADVDVVIEAIGDEDYYTHENADVNADSEINVADVDFIIERIV